VALADIGRTPHNRIRRRWLSRDAEISRISLIASRGAGWPHSKVMKQKILKTAKLALGLIAALALSSCLQNETTITLNKDGSGTIVEETMLGAQMMAMMTQFAQPGQPDPVEEMFKEEKAKAKTAKLGEGVEYVKTEMISKDGVKGARVHYKFADINKVKVSPGDAVGGDEAEAEAGKKDEPVKFAYADGKLRIIVPPADFDEMTPGGDEEDGGAQAAQMKQMLADMRVTVKLVVADGIAETNASHVDGNTLTLFDVQVGKMLAQEDEIDKIAETAKTDKAAAMTAFGKLDGIKIETREDVTVTLK
jgi:hypothetical protein